MLKTEKFKLGIYMFFIFIVIVCTGIVIFLNIEISNLSTEDENIYNFQNDCFENRIKTISNIDDIEKRINFVYYDLEIVENLTKNDLKTLKIKVTPKQINKNENEIYFIYKIDEDSYELKLDMNEFYQFVGEIQVENSTKIIPNIVIRSKNDDDIKQVLDSIIIEDGEIWD